MSQIVDYSSSPEPESEPEDASVHFDPNDASNHKSERVQSPVSPLSPPPRVSSSPSVYIEHRESSLTPLDGPQDQDQDMDTVTTRMPRRGSSSGSGMDVSEIEVLLDANRSGRTSSTVEEGRVGEGSKHAHMVRRVCFAQELK